jgi:hypothetical protein
VRDTQVLEHDKLLDGPPGGGLRWAGSPAGEHCH